MSGSLCSENPQASSWRFRCSRDARLTCGKQQMIQKRHFIFILNMVRNNYLESVRPQRASFPDLHSSHCGSTSPCIRKNMPHLLLKMRTFSHALCDSNINNVMLSQIKGLPINFAVGLSIHSLFWMEKAFLRIKHCKTL